MTKQETKTKGMCIATRCTSVEQFIQMFHRFVDEESFFVSTLNTRPPGLETSFSVQLADGTPVLRGLCVVMQAWTDASNPFKTPGVRLGIKRLTANSMLVFEQLLVTRSAAKAPLAGRAATAPGSGTPKPIAPVVTKPLGSPKPVTSVPKVITPLSPTPRPIAKSPFSETAPTRHAPSRVELHQPARASSEPVPEPITAVETTGVIEEKTDVREPKLRLVPLPPGATAPGATTSGATTSAADHTGSKPAAKPVIGAPGEAPRLTLPLAPPGPPTDKPAVDRPANDAKVEKPVETKPTADHPADASAEAKPMDGETSPGDEQRTPGSELVLPANPLMNLTDESLEGYVDCTLYEETGNFFPVDDDEAAIVDDVAPPPILAPRPAIARPPTPVPMGPNDRPPSTAFDERSDSTEIAAPRFQTAPKAAAYATPSATASETAKRESSPAIAVPPAAPRESVMVDPSLIARGSTPVFDGDAGSANKLPLAPAATPPPIPAAAGVLRPTPRRSPWGLVVGLFLVLGAAGVGGYLYKTRYRSENGPPESPPAKPTKQVAEVTPPVTDQHAVEPDKPPSEAGKPAGPRDLTGSGDESDESDEREPPSGSGPPVVGAGPCKVIVATTPAGSMVALDDKMIGPSPLTVAATCDKHKLDISHARYQPMTKLVTLSEAKPENIDVTLARPTHIVTVSSNPSGATIFIDGRSAGTTPTKLSVLGFTTLKLEFKKTGYQPTTTKLYSRVAQDSVSVRLNKW